SGDDGFVNGVASALVLRVVTTPADPYLARFCEHKPERPDVAQFWNGVIRPSCDQARRVSSLLQRQKRLETVFQYQRDVSSPDPRPGGAASTGGGDRDPREPGKTSS